jgi:hypothetical protein
MLEKLQSVLNLLTFFFPRQRSGFDISKSALDVFPPPYAEGYYAEQWVQKELGVPLNWTYVGNAVLGQFVQMTGDLALTDVSWLDHIASSGHKIALVFGDRDYRCSCEYKLAPSISTATYQGAL